MCLLIKTGTSKLNTFLTMRNKCVYFHSIKIHASEFDELSESSFCILLVVEAFSLRQVVEMLEGVVGKSSGDYGGWGKTS